MKIALAQMNVHVGDPAQNLQTLTKYVQQASLAGCDLVLAPELWATGYALSDWQRLAAPRSAGMFAQAASLARSHRIMLGGSLLEAADDRAYNTFALHSSTGELIQHYRKMHLFRLMDEDQWLGAGETLRTLDDNGARFGLAICYDLRFPEMFRQYALAGVSLVLLVAEWPIKRIDHWRTLLRARAIENQMFVAAVNRVGTTNGETFGGHSTIIDPWGQTLVEGDTSAGLLTAEIDLREVERVRVRIPVFEDRHARYEIATDSE